MKWPSLRICPGIVSDQLVTDSQQLHFNDSIFNYQYPPLSVQPFSATSFPIFFLLLLSSVPAFWRPGVLATQCTIATSWDVANAFNSNYFCWLLSGRWRPKGKGIPFQVESPALRFVAKGLTLWASGNKSGKCIPTATGYCVYMSGIKIVTRWLSPCPHPPIDLWLSLKQKYLQDQLRKEIHRLYKCRQNSAEKKENQIK